MHRLLLVVLVVLVVLVALITACGDLSSAQAGAPRPSTVLSTAPSPALTTTPGDCVTLARVPDRPAPPLAIADLGDGAKRVTSAEGGYSITVPSAWIVTGTFAGGVDPLFGQAHFSTYDYRAAPTSRPEAGGMLPPEVGIHLDIEVWANPLRDSLDRYAQGTHIGPDQTAVVLGSYVALGGRQAYRFTIQDERRFQPTNAPLITTRQTRAVWLVPTARDDRLLVVVATPAESPLLSVAERAVATLRLSTPVVSTLPVTIQRSDILAKWLSGSSGPIAGRRAEAKLMTYAEASAALMAPRTTDPNAPHSIGIPRIDHDPDELFWLVAVSGPDLPQGRGGPLSSATIPPTTWILYDTAATNGYPGSTGAQYAAGATAGTWPTVVDALPDRCH